MNVSNPGGHLDQLLRQTRAHHVQLSSMADVKANMLLTMSSIVITLSAPQAMKVESRWPLLVLIFFCLITVLLAAYAVMPKLPLTPQRSTPADPQSPRFNLLFFGDFTGLTYEQYAAEMEAMLNNPSRAYEVQVREVYLLGQFLASKKYRYLRLAYLSFICGLFASVITLIVTAVG